MSDMFVDPGEPGELKGSLRAKDLINKPLLLQPVAEERIEGQDGKPWHYVECHVVVIGMGGIEDHASGVRISWVRVLPQLTQRMRDNPGMWVAGIPKVQQDNSVILQPFSDRGRETARGLMDQVAALFQPAPAQVPNEVPPPPAFDAGEEPF